MSDRAPKKSRNLKFIGSALARTNCPARRIDRKIESPARCHDQISELQQIIFHRQFDPFALQVLFRLREAAGAALPSFSFPSGDECVVLALCHCRCIFRNHRCRSGSGCQCDCKTNLQRRINSTGRRAPNNIVAQVENSGTAAAANSSNSILPCMSDLGIHPAEYRIIRSLNHKSRALSLEVCNTRQIR